MLYHRSQRIEGIDLIKLEDATQLVEDNWMANKNNNHANPTFGKSE